MTNYLDETPVDALHKYVYEGLWQNKNEPAYRSLIWTLSNSYAFLILAAFTLLLTLAQRQSWNLLRQVLAQWKKPVCLRDDSCSNPLEHLSQLEAIKDTTSLVITSLGNIHSRNKNALILDTPVISPYFGVLSLLNVLIFICAGVAAPFILSEGWINMPIVKSKFTEECFNTTFLTKKRPIVSELPRVDAVFQQCRDQLGQDCVEQFYIKSPRIERARVDACPFEKEMCIEGLQSLELTHRNFTAFEAGFNIKSEFTMNRRLTCTPVNLEPTLKKSKHGNQYITVQDTHHPFNQYYSMKIETENGPNRFSNESSGLKMKRLKGRNDVSILPTTRTHTALLTREYLFPTLNRSLQKKDGMPFIIIWRGGTVDYREPVDDPFLSAHQELNRRNFPTYCSDQEATGLGCVEQLQICLPEIGRCSSWGWQSQNEEFLKEEANMEFLNRNRTPDYGYYEKVIFQNLLGDLMSQFFSLYRYLNFQAKFSKIEIPLTTLHKKLKKVEHGDEEWVFLVEKWFQKSYLQGIFWVQNGARWHLVESFSRLTPKQKEHISFCDRIVFRDSGYTNVNFLGVCLASIFLCLFCISSRLIKAARAELAKIKMFTARSLMLLRQARASWWLLILAAREKVNAALACNFTRRQGGEESAYFQSFSRRETTAIEEGNSHRERSTRPSPSSASEPYGLDDLRPNVSPSD